MSSSNTKTAPSFLGGGESSFGLRMVDEQTGEVVLDGTEDFETFRAKWKAHLVEQDRRDYEAGIIDKPPEMSWGEYWARGGKP